MIDELRIRGLGVIDEAVIDLGPGLTVLTGETGAGKTMVLTGLSLIMGGRAEAGIVRKGCDRADVDAVWVLPATAEVVASVTDSGGAVDETGDGRVAVALGRTVSSAGRSRAFAGGRSVPAATLADLTGHLVTVHGQSEQLRLRERSSQRDLLDRFGGGRLIALRRDFSERLTLLREKEREHADLLAHRQEREREATLLRHGIAEIDEVQPRPGEDAELKQQAVTLAHATELLEALGSAHAFLVGGEADAPSAADLAGSVQRDLDRAAGLDPTLAPLSDDGRRLAESISVLAAEVADRAGALQVDPERLAEAQERRQRLSELKRRYGPELEDVLTWWREAQDTVAQVDGTDDRLATLHDEIASLRVEVQECAKALTKSRTAAARELSARVTAELRELAMPDASLTVDIATVTDVDDMTPAGADIVTMLLTPHVGSEPRPLGAGASGGELSRLMLAIEVVLADVDGTPTFVFDEVDAGIGGRVAVEVGRRLARLARRSQVIVVTHLPQVAAFADAHVVVAKDSAGQVTASSITRVEGDERVRELVRMLSGLEGSASGAEHAGELLQLAEADRAAAPAPGSR